MPRAALRLPPGTFPDGSVNYGTSATFGVDCGCDVSTPGPVPVLNPGPGQTPAPAPDTVDVTVPPIPVIGDGDDDVDPVGTTESTDAAAVNGPGSVWSLAAAAAAAVMAFAVTGAWW